LHNKGYLHRDLKPENILIGLEENASTLFLIDYGLAKKWKQSSGEHIQFKEGKSLTGTARYASANTHLGIEQSRRDDLEGAGYVLLYLLMGELPWQGLRGKNKDEKYKKIKECKVSTPVQQLCQGYPKEFLDYMLYCRNLGFTEDPDYEYLRRIFKELYANCGFENESIFDWTIQRFHSKINQANFGIQMGLLPPKHGGSSGSGSQRNSGEEEKVSMENVSPASHEEIVEANE
jgi:serine/threonine protein kinase